MSKKQVGAAPSGATDSVPKSYVDAQDVASPRVLSAVKASGTWPARPTSNPSTVVMWIGADPDPAVVTTGTAGMYAGDIRIVF